MLPYAACAGNVGAGPMFGVWVIGLPVAGLVIDKPPTDAGEPDRRFGP